MSKRGGESSSTGVDSPAEKRGKGDPRDNKAFSSSLEEDTKEKEKQKMIEDPQLAILLQAIQDGQKENRERFSSLENKVDRNEAKSERRFDLLEKRVAALEVGGSDAASVMSVSTAATGNGSRRKIQQPAHFSFSDNDLEPDNWRYSLPPT